MSEIPTYTIEDFERVLPPEPPPKAPPAKTSKGNGVDHSEDEKLKRASAYLAAIPGAVQGQHGDDQTFKALVHCGILD